MIIAVMQKGGKMGRLLDEDDVLKEIDRWNGYLDEDMITRIKIGIKKLPPAQPEMVKCKKCRYVYYDKEFGNYWCDRMSDSFKVEADGYCKWGK